MKMISQLIVSLVFCAAAANAGLFENCAQDSKKVKNIVMEMAEKKEGPDCMKTMAEKLNIDMTHPKTEEEALKKMTAFENALKSMDEGMQNEAKECAMEFGSDVAGKFGTPSPECMASVMKLKELWDSVSEQFVAIIQG